MVFFPLLITSSVCNMVSAEFMRIRMCVFSKCSPIFLWLFLCISLDFLFLWIQEDEQLQTGEMQGGQEADAVVVKCLQQAGIIPATLDFFKPSCTLHINYKSTLELKIGDCVFLRQMSEGPPNVAILKNYQDQSASSLQGTATTTLFTLMMVALDSESKDGAHYLHWILANISNQYLTSSAGEFYKCDFVILHILQIVKQSLNLFPISFRSCYLFPRAKSLSFEH